MPIGPITPGNRVTITPDPSPGLYTLLQAPTNGMDVVAEDWHALTLAVLNIQEALNKAKAGVEVFSYAHDTTGLGATPIETFTGGSGAQFASVVKVGVTGCLPGDVIMADLGCELKGIESGGDFASAPGAVRLAMAVPSVSSPVVLEGVGVVDAPGRRRVSLTGIFSVTVAGTMTIGLDVYLSSGQSVQALYSAAVRAVRIRKG